MVFAVASLFALGCAEATSVWQDPTADDDWSASIHGQAHTAEWTAEDVAAAFLTAVSAGVPSPPPVLTSYKELLGHADEVCPGDFFHEGFLAMEGCTSTDGTTFRGAAGLVEEDARVYAEDGAWTGTYAVMFAPADYVILRPDGTELDGNGNTDMRITRRDGEIAWTTSMLGSFRDTGAEGWLGLGFSGNFQISGFESASGRSSGLNGALSVNGAAISLDNLAFDEAVCPEGAMGGSIGVRQPDATWYTITMPSRCSSCGDLTWEGSASLGEACLDLQALREASAAMVEF